MMSIYMYCIDFNFFSTERRKNKGKLNEAA